MNEPNFSKMPWQIIPSEKPSLVEIYDYFNDMVCGHIDDEDNAALLVCAPEMYWELVRCANLFRDLKIYPVVNTIETLLQKARGESEVIP